MTSVKRNSRFWWTAEGQPTQLFKAPGTRLVTCTGKLERTASVVVPWTSVFECWSKRWTRQVCCCSEVSAYRAGYKQVFIVLPVAKCCVLEGYFQGNNDCNQHCIPAKTKAIQANCKHDLVFPLPTHTHTHTHTHTKQWKLQWHRKLQTESKRQKWKSEIQTMTSLGEPRTLLRGTKVREVQVCVLLWSW